VTQQLIHRLALQRNLGLHDANGQHRAIEPVDRPLRVTLVSKSDSLCTFTMKQLRCIPAVDVL
jgi:hypothetical protein